MSTFPTSSSTPTGFYCPLSCDCDGRTRERELVQSCYVLGDPEGEARVSREGLWALCCPRVIEAHVCSRDFGKDYYYCLRFGGSSSEIPFKFHPIHHSLTGSVTFFLVL